MLKERFGSCKEGARIVSSLNFSPLNFTINQRNLWVGLGWVGGEGGGGPLGALESRLGGGEICNIRSGNTNMPI